MSERELKQWEELRKDLQEIKELNNSIYNINVTVIHDMKNDLVKHECK